MPLLFFVNIPAKVNFVNAFEDILEINMLKLGDFVLTDFLKESTDSSSKRLVLFMAATAMSIGVIILTIASFYTTVADTLMWALTIPLSTMAGVSYASVEKDRLKLAQIKAGSTTAPTDDTGK